MKYLLFLLLVAATPAPLLITKGGTYFPQNGQPVVFMDSDGKLVNIGDPSLKTAYSPGPVSQATGKPVNVAFNNCWFVGTPGKESILLYRVTHLFVNHCDFAGIDDAHGTGGGLVGNFGSAIDGSVYCCSFHNIDGMIGGVENKMAAWQFQNWSGVPKTIAWCSIVNSGISKTRMEDGFSFELSPGKSFDQPAIIHNCLVVGCPSDSPSGSGILGGDPGSVMPGDPRAQLPLYTVITNNITVGLPNQGVTLAYGSDFKVQNNITVSTGGWPIHWGLQLQNWDNKTDAARFGRNVVVDGNQSWCVYKGKHYDFSLTSPITGTNNTTLPMTNQQALELFEARCTANKITVGPTVRPLK